jgi:hypothetical protein
LNPFGAKIQGANDLESLEECSACYYETAPSALFQSTFPPKACLPSAKLKKDLRQSTACFSTAPIFQAWFDAPTSFPPKHCLLSPSAIGDCSFSPPNISYF